MLTKLRIKNFKRLDDVEAEPGNTEGRTARVLDSVAPETMDSRFPRWPSRGAVTAEAVIEWS